MDNNGKEITEESSPTACLIAYFPGIKPAELKELGKADRETLGELAKVELLQAKA